MKTRIFIFASFVIAFCSNSTAKKITADQIPQAVQYTLKAKYPDATAKKWKKENDTYIAECKQGKKEYEAAFSADGKWMNTATTIQWKEVPETVKTAYNKSTYTKWRMDKVTKMDSSDGTTLYVVEADNGDKYDPSQYDVFKETHKVYISPQGQIIKHLKRNSSNTFLIPAKKIRHQ